jgi:hypothetical protein
VPSAEVAADIGHPLAQFVDDVAVRLLVAERGSDGLLRALAQVVIGPVVDRDTDDRAVQQAAALQLVERHEGHLLGEVAADPERDQHVRLLRLATLIHHHASTCSPVRDRP